MAEYVAILLTAGCALAGGWMLLAAWRGKRLLRLPREMRHMESTAHVGLALVLIVLPLPMYQHQLHWSVMALASTVLFGYIVHTCVLDRRESRRRRNGPSSAFDADEARR